MLISDILNICSISRQSQLDASLATYRLALEGCKDQREMQLICLHELGQFTCPIMWIYF